MYSGGIMEPFLDLFARLELCKIVWLVIKL